MPLDDPSLKVLVANNSDTLKLLNMSSCPHVSPAGQYTLSIFLWHLVLLYREQTGDKEKKRRVVASNVSGWT